MKFKAKVAVCRQGRIAYWTQSAVAMRMVRAGLAKRNGQGMIELPGEGSEQDLKVTALLSFKTGLPTRLCYGSHTSPNTDRMTWAPAVHNAPTGQVSAHYPVFMKVEENENAAR